MMTPSMSGFNFYEMKKYLENKVISGNFYYSRKTVLMVLFKISLIIKSLNSLLESVVRMSLGKWFHI